MTTAILSGALAHEQAIELQVSARQAMRRRTMWIWVGRVALAVIVVGG